MIAKTAFDQLDALGRNCVAGLIGAEDCVAFRNQLRDMLPLTNEGWTFGEMAIHYLNCRLEYLKKD